MEEKSSQTRALQTSLMELNHASHTSGDQGGAHVCSTRERERERETFTSVDTYVYRYICIYIYRERGQSTRTMLASVKLFEYKVSRFMNLF